MSWSSSLWTIFAGDSFKVELLQGQSISHVVNESFLFIERELEFIVVVSVAEESGLAKDFLSFSVVQLWAEESLGHSFAGEDRSVIRDSNVGGGSVWLVSSSETFKVVVEEKIGNPDLSLRLSKWEIAEDN